MRSRATRLVALTFSALLAGCALIVGIGDLNGPPASRPPDAGTVLADAREEDVVASSQPPSCAAGGPGRSTCGGSRTESCCESRPVPGGDFLRFFDGVKVVDRSWPATVSSFRLDRYKVTVGRFRAFVSHVVTTGWRPPQSAGLHAHIQGGRGLTGSGGGNELGWDAAAWNAKIPSSLSGWSAALTCDGGRYTWTETLKDNENLPLTCLDWVSAYAFCIWDGGFLPTLTESLYAASGGGGDAGQRVYPWSTPSTSAVYDCAHMIYGDGNVGVCDPPGTHDVGATSPAGDGAFGQADLVGNAWEWVLDWSGGEFDNPCRDCVTTTPTEDRRCVRGASYKYTPNQLNVSQAWGKFLPDIGGDPDAAEIGFRCARAP